MNNTRNTIIAFYLAITILACCKTNIIINDEGNSDHIEFIALTHEDTGKIESDTMPKLLQDQYEDANPDSSLFKFTRK